jgi:hypothetical protein
MRLVESRNKTVLRVLVFECGLALLRPAYLVSLLVQVIATVSNFSIPSRIFSFQNRWAESQYYFDT